MHGILGDVARFVVDHKPQRAADGTWVVLPPPSEKPVEQCGEEQHGEEQWPSLTSSAASEASMQGSQHEAQREAQHEVFVLDDEWVTLHDVGRPCLLSEASCSETASEFELVGETISELAESDLIESELIGSDVLGSDELGSEAIAILDESFRDPPSEEEGEPKVGRTGISDGGGNGDGRAWRGATTTKKALGLDCVSGAFAPPNASSIPQSTPPNRESNLSALLSPPTPVARTGLVPTTEDEMFDGESGHLDELAGLKDSRHRAIGGRCLSLKATEKRNDSVAKRQAQREQQRSRS